MPCLAASASLMASDRAPLGGIQPLLVSTALQRLCLSQRQPLLSFQALLSLLHSCSLCVLCFSSAPICKTVRLLVQSRNLSWHSCNACNMPWRGTNDRTMIKLEAMHEAVYSECRSDLSVLKIQLCRPAFLACAWGAHDRHSFQPAVHVEVRRWASAALVGPTALSW